MGLREFCWCWIGCADLLSSLLVFFVCLVSCLFRYSVALGMTSRSMLPSTDRLDTLIFRHIGIDRRIGSLIMSLLDKIGCDETLPQTQETHPE